MWIGVAICKGNDNGTVEGLVEYARRNFMVPVPRAANGEELNDHFWSHVASGGSASPGDKETRQICGVCQGGCMSKQTEFGVEQGFFDEPADASRLKHLGSISVTSRQGVHTGKPDACDALRCLRRRPTLIHARLFQPRLSSHRQSHCQRNRQD